MAEDHDVPEENRFTDWKEALNKTKFADAVIISLPDNLHYGKYIKQSLWKPIVHLLTWRKNVEHSLSMTVNEKKIIRLSTV